jgi:hypothetical protein
MRPAHQTFGNPQGFAIELGSSFETSPTSGLRVVDIWAAGRELCCDDNRVFVPQFCLSIEATITWLLWDHDLSLPSPDLSPEENHRRVKTDPKEREGYRFLDWGPTTDNLTAFLFQRDRSMLITFEFWRETHPRPHEIGQVYVAEVPDKELLRCLHQTVCALRNGT